MDGTALLLGMYGDLRRLLATIDYRFALAVRDAPSDFGGFDVGEGVRTPFQIVRHLSDMLRLIMEQFEPVTMKTTKPTGDFASGPAPTADHPPGVAPATELASNVAPATEPLSGAASTTEDSSPMTEFEAESLRFRQLLRQLDEILAAGARLSPTREGLDFAGLLQGPVSDALTHVGQLTLLRRLAGSPVHRVRYWQVDMPLPSERR